MFVRIIFVFAVAYNLFIRRGKETSVKMLLLHLHGDEKKLLRKKTRVRDAAFRDCNIYIAPRARGISRLRALMYIEHATIKICIQKGRFRGCNASADGSSSQNFLWYIDLHILRNVHYH